MIFNFTRIIFVCVSLLLFASTLSVASTTPIPEEADGPLLVWKEKAKYYLVITVDDTGVKNTELPFTITDGQKIIETFNHLGYTPLIATQPLFRNPTRDDIITALRGIRDFPEHASIIVYYSGHGVAEPKNQDVWLQLGGQKQIGDHFGISVTELIGIPRGATYLGELYVIVDACFSGLGGLSQKLTLRDLGTKTAVLTSNQLKESKLQKTPEQQLSYPITLDDGTTISAFTHTLIQGLGADWHIADDNGDGILHISELKRYSEFHLEQRFSKEPHKAMVPQLIATDDKERFLAYRRDGVTRWNSLPRRALTLVALERSLIPQLTDTVSGETEKPKVSQNAQTFAKQFSPQPDDPYAQGIKAQAEGRLKEAKTLFAKAEKLEEAHKEKLAKIYLARGRNETYAGNHKDALPWYQKRVTLKPTRDPALLNEFGQAWDRTGKYDEALPFYKEALAIRKRTLDPGDQDLALSLNNLASLYKSQGKYDDAERLFKEALAINKKTLEPDDPRVAIIFNNLGGLYASQGNCAKAETLYNDALAIRREAFGPKHPAVTQSLSNLALTYQNQRKYTEAAGLYHDAILIIEQALGSTHPLLATILHNQAEFYRLKGEYAKVEPLYKRALAIKEEAFGTDHPKVALSLNNIAKFYEDQN